MFKKLLDWLAENQYVIGIMAVTTVFIICATLLWIAGSRHARNTEACLEIGMVYVDGYCIAGVPVP